MELVNDILGETQNPVRIREDPHSGIVLEGAEQIKLDGPEHCVRLIRNAEMKRAEAATAANNRSSRSHAVVILRREVKKAVSAGSGRDASALRGRLGSAASAVSDQDRGLNSSFLTTDGESVISDGKLQVARFHIVDLAGSERVKKTNAWGLRLGRGICLCSSSAILGWFSMLIFCQFFERVPAFWEIFQGFGEWDWGRMH